MNKLALSYYHKMRDQGFSVDASRNSTLIMFTDPVEFERRMKRYPLESTMEQDITCGTQAAAVRALDRRHEQLRHPEPNQKEIDRKSAELLKMTFCAIHGRPMRRYIDGVWACPDCEADKVLNISI